MTIDTTDWKKLPWWRAVRRVYEIPDVVSDRNAAEIVALELAGHLEPISNETEWGEALTSAESTIAALVKAGSAGELDHALCDSGRVTFGAKGGRSVSNAHDDAVAAIAARAKPNARKEAIRPLWEAVYTQMRYRPGDSDAHQV